MKSMTKNDLSYITNTLLEQVPALIQFIGFPTLDQSKSVIDKDPSSIRFMPQTFNVCMYALEKDASVIRFIKYPTIEMINFSIEKDISNFLLLNEQPEEICWDLLRRDVKNIKYILKPTISMCGYALLAPMS